MIDNFWAEQAGVRCKVNPEVFLRGIVHDLVDKIRTQKGLAACGSKHAAGRGFEPVDGTARRVFRHALDAIVIGPAVVTIEIAFPFGEEVSNDGLKVSGQDA